ncbi:Nicotinamidase [Erysiphe neolycopersici]|uniref:nicotinamidase n=1 Tax=Erysiphe neolycopersici TaxID=212602 RepID=A0A420HXB8_9PEZI|nr:Nicotinamidase [Erysiphe neolycopersici]
MAVSNQKTQAVKALLVVDVQEDFCSKNGSLAIPNGSDTIPIINKLLNLPFALKIASKDWHPKSHVSFASNHQGKKPFLDLISIRNPANAEEEKKVCLWPNHCVVDTFGAELVSELAVHKIDLVIKKGTEENAEMHSMFYDIWGKDSGLLNILREKNVTDVLVVGVAFDYCVKETAIHAAEEGFRTIVIKEATKATSTENWRLTEKDLFKSGVKVLSIDDDVIHGILDGS